MSLVEKNTALTGRMLEVPPTLPMASIAVFNRERVLSCFLGGRESVAMVEALGTGCEKAVQRYSCKEKSEARKNQRLLDPFDERPCVGGDGFEGGSDRPP